MNAVFYLTAGLAVLSTAMAITRIHAVHALLYLIVSFLAVAMIFLLLGAPFVAALEIIIYAGAIVVLFIFVVMMLCTQNGDISPDAGRFVRQWKGPLLIAAFLGGEMVYLFSNHVTAETVLTQVGVKQVGQTLLGPYVIGVELASMLLLPGLIGAYYLGRRLEQEGQR